MFSSLQVRMRKVNKVRPPAPQHFVGFLNIICWPTCNMATVNVGAGDSEDSGEASPLDGECGGKLLLNLGIVITEPLTKM